MSLDPIDIDINMRQNVSEESSKASRNFSSLSRTVTKESESMQAHLTRLGIAVGGVFSARALYDWSQTVIKVTAENQMLSKSFEVLLGSKAASDRMVYSLRGIALQSPLSVKDLSSAAQTLLGFNVAADKVIPTLKQLGAISMGNSDRFRSLALAFAQMSSTGKLMGQDLLQMVNAGFNPLMIMSEKTGKSITELRDEMSKGAISSEMVADAFRSATEEGGKFSGMLEKQAEGIVGYEAKLTSAIEKAMTDIGTQNEDLIISGYKTATQFVENYREIGNILLEVIGIYGSYKAAVLAVNIAHKSIYIAGNVKAWLQLAAGIRTARDAQIAFNLATSASPLGVLAAAVAGIAVGYKLFTNNASQAVTKQSLLNKVTNEAAGSLAREKSELELLLSIARNDKVSRDARISAIEKLNRISPDYLGNLRLENINATEASSAIDRYTQSIEKNAKAKAIAAQLQAITEQELANTQRMAEIAEEVASRNPFQKLMDRANRLMNYPGAMNESFIIRAEKETAAIDKENKELERQKKLLYDINLQNEREGRPKAQIPEFIQIAADRKNLEELEKKHAELSDRMANNPIVLASDKAMLEIYNKQIGEIQKRLSAYKKEIEEPVKNFDYWDKQKDAAEKALKAMKAEQKGSAEWLEKERLLREASENLKLYDFSDKSLRREETDAEKRLNAQRTLQDKLKQLSLDNEAALLSILTDGKEKRLKEIDLEYRDTLQAIKKQKDGIIEAYNKANGLTAGAKVTPENMATRMPDEYNNLLKAENLALKAKQATTVELERTTAKELQSIRDGVDSKFNTELQNQLRDIRAFYAEQLRLKKLSIEEAKALQDREERLARQNADLKYNDVNSGLDVYRSETNTMNSSMTERAEREKLNILKSYAQQRLEILRNMGTEEAEIEAKSLELVIERYDKTLSKPRSIKGLIDDAAFKKVNNHFKKITSSEEEATEKTNSFFEKFQEGGSKAVEVLSFMQDSFGGMNENLDMALDAAMDIAEGFASGGLVGGIEAAASNIISATLKLITAKKEVSKETIDTYNAYIDLLDRLIDKQIESLDSLSHTDFLQTAGKTYQDLLKEQSETVKILQETFRSGSGLFSHSVGYKINEDLKKQASYLRGIGIYTTDIGRMNSDQLVSLQQIPSLWARLPEEVRNYIEKIREAKEQTDDLNAQIQDMLLGFDFTAITDGIIEAFTDPSVDNAIGSLGDKVDNWIGGIVKNIIRQVALITPVTAAVNNLMKGIGKYDKDGNLVGFKNRKDINQDVFSQFKQSIMNIGADFGEIWSEVSDMFQDSGIDITGEKDQERTGTSEALQSVTQDSFDAAVGRIYAIQISVNDLVNLKKEELAASGSVTSILDVLEVIADNTQFCRRLERMDNNIEEIKTRGLKWK